MGFTPMTSVKDQRPSHALKIALESPLHCFSVLVIQVQHHSSSQTWKMTISKYVPLICLKYPLIISFQLPISPSMPTNQTVLASSASVRIPSTPSAFHYSPSFGTPPPTTPASGPPTTSVSTSGSVSIGFPGLRLQAPTAPRSPSPMTRRSQTTATTPHEWQATISRRASHQRDNDALFLIAPDEKLAAEAFISQLIAHHSDGPPPVFPPRVRIQTFSFDDLLEGMRTWHVYVFSLLCSFNC